MMSMAKTSTSMECMIVSTVTDIINIALHTRTLTAHKNGDRSFLGEDVGRAGGFAAGEWHEK